MYFINKLNEFIWKSSHPYPTTSKARLRDNNKIEEIGIIKLCTVLLIHMPWSSLINDAPLKIYRQNIISRLHLRRKDYSTQSKFFNIQVTKKNNLNNIDN